MGRTRPCLLSCEALESRLQPAVTFHGGVVLPHVQAQAVYIGSEWASTPGKAKVQALDGFLSYLVQSPYMDALTSAGYNVGRGTASPGVIDNLTLNKSYYLTDAQIQKDIQAEIKAGKVQPPDANRVYVVYVEPGVAVAGSDGSDSITSFLGYHAAFGGHTASGQAIDIHYVVVPYPGGYDPSARSQGFPTNFTEMTAVTSHELAETATDPNVDYKRLGWYDNTYNSEIGDLTEGDVRELGGYYVQLLINKTDHVLNVSGATTATGTAPSGGVGGSGFDSETVAHVNPHAPTPLLPGELDEVNWGFRVG